MAGLEPLLQQNGRIRLIRAHGDDIGLGGQYVVQFCAVAGLIGLIDDEAAQFSAFGFPCLLEVIRQAHKSGVVECHDGRPLEAALAGHLSKGLAEYRVGRLKHPCESTLVLGLHLGSAAGVHHDQACVVGKRHHCETHGGRPDANNSLNTINFDELLCRQNGNVGLGLVILCKQLEFSPRGAAGAVDFIDGKPNGFEHGRPVRASNASD